MLKEIKVSDLPITATEWRKLRAHAIHSMYRMNATTADCYAFGISEDKKSWCGGWDWSKDIVDKTASYLLMFKTEKVYEIID
jgi:hypothetical protein